MIKNLIDEVYELLCVSGLKKEADNNFLGNQDIAIYKQLDLNNQLIILNRYWRYQFSIYGDESKHARYCLVDTGTADQWLLLFKNAVLPFVISKNLPREIG